MKYITARDAVRYALGKSSEPTGEGGVPVSLGYCYMIAGIALLIGLGMGMVIASRCYSGPL